MPRRSARPAPPADCADALREIRRLVATLAQSARAVEQRTGVTNAQLFLLRALADGDSLSINDLARRALTGQNTISAVVTRLEDNGLVKRERSDVDARVVGVAITARGRRVASRAPEPPTERLLDVLCALSASELRTVTRALAILNSGLGLDRGAPDELLFERGSAR